ncbi:MAG: hypothetical protein NTW33_00670 [Methanoregula sp.]|nr:hypothetical protein [Methanoregula sp.]
MTVLLGWDVAQTTDSSIIAVLEYDGNPAMYWVRRIVKLAKGMPYDQQVKAVRELFFQYQSPQASITKVIQERRLKVVKGCENAGLFRSELKNFQLKVSASGHNTYNAAPGSHDDSITAIGLCLWYAARIGRNTIRGPRVDQAFWKSPPDDRFGFREVEDLRTLLERLWD